MAAQHIPDLHLMDTRLVLHQNPSVTLRKPFLNMSMAKLLLHHFLSESNELRKANLFSPHVFGGWSVPAPTQQSNFRATHAPQKT